MHFLVKKGVKIKPNKIFWAATNIIWVVSFTDFELWSFCQTKSWKLQNTVFGYKKGLKNSMPSSFLIRDLNIVGSFICYFWFITILSSQKLKNAKYRFGLQKGVKNSIRQDFLIRDPQIVGSFICYFCLKMTGTPKTFGGGFSVVKPPPKRFEICNFQAESFGPVAQNVILTNETHIKSILLKMFLFGKFQFETRKIENLI